MDAVDELLAADGRRRELLPQLEELRAEKNRASKRIGELEAEAREAAIAEARALGDREGELEEEVAAAERRRDELLATLPNLPDESAPAEDEVLRAVGEAGRAGRDHLDLLGDLVDLEAGARVAGSRFAYLKGPLVRLELALVQWVLDLLEEHGFTPVVPPVLVREEALFGTGFLPDTEQQIYRVPDDELYLAGTSEVPLASLHAGQVLDELPLRYAGFSTCFRREAGAAGKDTRGMFRVHQFDKLEMFSFVEPERSDEEHERLLAIEEEIFQTLEVPYRVVNIAVNDLGNSAAKKYDVEAWLPGDAGGRYREVTSCSNTTDYQARRIDCRYRPVEGKGTEHVHTLNGTAIAVGRTIISIVENHQEEEGSIRIPEVLHAYGAPSVIAAA